MPVEAAQSTIHHLVGLDGDRDHAAEVQALLRIIHARQPRATSLLDVTDAAGAHLRLLGPHFPVTEAVAADPATAAAVRNTVPGVSVHEADLPDLDLGRRYDVVTYLHDPAAQYPLTGYRMVLRSLAAHLHPGGLLLLAPFWMPDVTTRREGGEDLVRDEHGRVVTRVFRAVPHDGAHRMERHALVADGAGVRHHADTRLLHAFGRWEHLNALAAAGCGGDFLTDGLAGRSLLVGVRR
ncbi:hypothetical protein [Micromonospora fulviviridis]|uniref:hypothetical protein n=1 Tax=Micromonospora fulviviridis TaxID=47860 RepID=UPI0037A3DF22